MVLWLSNAWSQTYQLPPFFQTDWAWVDSVYSTMSEEERIAQLIMIPAWSNRGPEHQEEILKLITDYGIGGIALAFLGAGKPLLGIFTEEVVFTILTPILLLMVLGFTYGFVKKMKNPIK